MSQLAFFYHPGIYTPDAAIVLSEDSSRHIVQVLRKSESDELMLCNGQGEIALAEICAANKKHCTVRIKNVTRHENKQKSLHLGVAFTKNTSRNEWILEKAAELGVRSIVPLNTRRTEKEKFKEERWRNILVSAMLQSQQYFLPTLYPSTNLKTIIKDFCGVPQKLVAHCDTSFERIPIHSALKKEKETLILIGPEGDFSSDEIEELYKENFNGITLCTQRLRTETAATAAAAYFNLLNHE